MGRRLTPIARWSIHATGLADSSRAPTSRISLSSRLMTMPFCIRRRCSRAPFLLRGVSPRGRRTAEQRDEQQPSEWSGERYVPSHRIFAADARAHSWQDNHRQRHRVDIGTAVLLRLSIRSQMVVSYSGLAWLPMCRKFAMSLLQRTCLTKSVSAAYSKVCGPPPLASPGKCARRRLVSVRGAPPRDRDGCRPGFVVLCVRAIPGHGHSRELADEQTC